MTDRNRPMLPIPREWSDPVEPVGHQGPTSTLRERIRKSQREEPEASFAPISTAGGSGKNREVLLSRAVKSLLQTDEPWVKEMAPLTRHEQQQAREKARAMKAKIAAGEAAEETP